jgi:SH3 domain protein
MGEDENLQKDMKKQEEQDASKKALKTGAKAAANAYLGPAGGKAVDLASKTKLGDNILNKGAESINKKAPKIGKIANAANKNGALDAADKAVDATSGGADSLGKDGLPPEEGLIDKSNNIDGNIIGNNNEITDNEDDNNPFNSFFDTFNHSTQNNLDNTNNSLEKFIKKHKLKLILIISSVFLFIIIIVTIISAIYSVGDVFTNFINGIENFFTEDQQELEKEYYEDLKQVQTDIHNKYGICIDANLITAALTINKSFDELLDESKDEVEDEIDGEEAETVSYKKMKKQIKLLANMQIMTNRYEKSSECADSESTTLITEGDKDSSTKELIASHDADGSNPFSFLLKKSSQEKNYVYYKYTPAYEITKVGDTEIKTCPSNAKAPEDTKEISIGDLSNMEDSVFYWNLVNSFIPDYYADYLPESEPKKTEAIKKIAEDIYLLYQDMGPSQSCSMDYNFICRSDEGSNYYSGTTGNATASRTEFMNNISPVAISEMTRTGVYASVTMAQAALESANGGSGLSTKYANYYGMTAGTCAPKAAPSGVSGTVYRSGEGGNTCSGNSFWDGTVVAMCNSSGKDCQWYRVYDSFENSTRDHSRLLSDKYNCNVYGSNSEQLQCIKDHGYATDPNYVSKILNVIKTYNLSQYDIGTWDGTTTSYDSPTYNNKICYNGGSTNSGTFTSWKQYDSQWSNVRLGNKTVGKIGCAMTSVAIQIMRSGSPLSIEEFNPGTFAQALTKAGGFDAAGNITWSAVERIAPNFKFVDRVNHRPSLQELNNLVSQGYYVILNVKYGRHWVAIDSVDVANNKIYMFDPGSPGTEVGETYGLNSIQRYVYYRRV